MAMAPWRRPLPVNTRLHTPLMAVRTAVSGARASGEDLSGLYAYHLEKTYTAIPSCPKPAGVLVAAVGKFYPKGDSIIVQ